jgi:hypothetical protein
LHPLESGVLFPEEVKGGPLAFVRAATDDLLIDALSVSGEGEETGVVEDFRGVFFETPSEVFGDGDIDLVGVGMSFDAELEAGVFLESFEAFSGPVVV